MNLSLNYKEEQNFTGYPILEQSVSVVPSVDFELYALFFSNIKSRQDILDIEERIYGLDTVVDKTHFPLFHSFADGMYTREAHIAKGYIVSGEIHRNDYFINITKGKLWVMSEFGSREIIAPFSFTAKAGVKHIVYTLEDTVWSDTHKTDKTDIEEAEADIFVKSYEEYDKIKKIHEVLGIDEDDVALLTYQDNSDLIDQPEDYIEVRKSPIDGLGVFTKKALKKGDKIVARINNNRTPVGRYTNHSDTPNSEPIIEGNKAFFSALVEIKNDSEITINYGNVRDKAKSLDRYMLCQEL